MFNLFLINILSSDIFRGEKKVICNKFVQQVCFICQSCKVLIKSQQMMIMIIIIIIMIIIIINNNNNNNNNNTLFTLQNGSADTIVPTGINPRAAKLNKITMNLRL